MAGPSVGPGPLWRRLAWFAVIWAASILALGVVGFILKTWLKAA
ncbi:oxidase [Methylobacterium sp. Leaf399]|nr:MULTISPECIES: DUF2474 domain-containing protein [unclassified Methylobacterium]KQP54875.1 oxidase [Methylobacterium sp. Leaf108]KQT09229.1 oxidase [Methylobacterium sp. Leaf399]KQT78846.1 oxidase [Methylobacterium sp. Leaf466]